VIRITPEILNTFFIIYKLIDLTDHYWFDGPKVLGDSEDDLKLKIFNKYLRNLFKMIRLAKDSGYRGWYGIESILRSSFLSGSQQHFYPGCLPSCF